MLSMIKLANKSLVILNNNKGTPNALPLISRVSSDKIILYHGAVAEKQHFFEHIFSWASSDLFFSGRVTEVDFNYPWN